jgi:hypothetical protein
MFADSAMKLVMRQWAKSRTRFRNRSSVVMAEVIFPTDISNVIFYVHCTQVAISLPGTVYTSALRVPGTVRVLVLFHCFIIPAS